MGILLDFVGGVRRAVRHHGGIVGVFRRMWEVMAFEGFLGLKRKITRIVHQKAFLFSHDQDAATRLQTATNPQKSLGSIRRVLSPGALLLGHPYGVLGIGENIR